MIDFIHIGDVHLDSPFSSLSGTLGDIRRDELRETLLRCVEFAGKYNVDAAFISGDLFDSEYVSRVTLRTLTDALAKAGSTRFFIAPGNHDRIFKNSPYLQTGWPGNVHIFTGPSPERVDLPELGLSVYGLAAESFTADSRPLEGFRAGDGLPAKVMVLHGQVTGSPSSQTPYGPISNQEIADSGLTYLALGHVHSYSGLQKAGATYWAYPGCLEGRGYDETGEKGFIRGRLEGGDCRIEFIPVAKRRCEDVAVSLDGVSTYEQALERVVGRISGIPQGSVLRIRLTGRTDGFSPNPEVIKSRVDGMFHLAVEDATSPEVDLEALAGERSLSGIFARRMLEAVRSAGDEQEKEVAEVAMRYGFSVLAGEKVDVHEA